MPRRAQAEPHPPLRPSRPTSSRRPALPTPSPQSGSPFPPEAARSPSRKRPRVTFQPGSAGGGGSGGRGEVPGSPSPPARFFGRGSGKTAASPLGLPPRRPGSPVSSDDSSLSPSTTTLADDLPPPLPKHLSHLLAFHRAFSLSLAHTLAAHPPVLPPPTTRELARDPRGLNEQIVLLKGVANWEGTKGIREVVERGAGRKCTGGDLKRLLWLYEWDGQALPVVAPAAAAVAAPVTPTAVSDSPTDPFFLPPPPPPAGSPAEVDASRSLLSLSLSPTRTLAKGTRTQTHSYAFNLRLPVSGFAGGVVGSIGRWSADQQKREAAVRRRLERWAELGGGSVLPMKVLQPLPGATIPAGATSGSAILGPPSSPSSTTPVVVGGGCGSNRRVVGGSATALPTPPQSSHSQSVRRLLFPSPTSSSTASSDPAVGPSSSATPPSTPTKAAPLSAASDRRQSLRDRIAAKEAASAPLGGLFAAAGIRPASVAGDKGKASSEGRMLSREELKRRSTLSRLAGVAEAVFMCASQLGLYPLLLYFPSSKKATEPLCSLATQRTGSSPRRASSQALARPAADSRASSAARRSRSTRSATSSSSRPRSKSPSVGFPFSRLQID